MSIVEEANEVNISKKVREYKHHITGGKFHREYSGHHEGLPELKPKKILEDRDEY